MKQIYLTDVSLFESQKKADRNYSFKEQLELIKTLDKLNVNRIKLCPIVSQKVDTTTTRTFAAAVKNSTLALPCVTLTKGEIDNAWNAISTAVKPQILLCAPTSVVQMEYFFHQKPDKMAETVTSAVTYAKSLCQNVAFEAQDATRSEVDFLCKVLKSALDAGANDIILCDSAATFLPNEFTTWMNDVYTALPELKNVCVTVQCANDLSMAAACAVGAICAGANGVCVAVNDTASVPSLEAVSQILRSKGDDCKISSALAITQLGRALQQLKMLLQRTPAKTMTQENNYTALELDQYADIDAVAKAVRDLGYDLSEEDLTSVFASVCDVAKQKTVGAKELDAIIASVALQVPPTYNLESYVINSGSDITATACIKLRKDGVAHSAVCCGHGPIDAAFAAIDEVLGHHYELDDFQIQSITEGSEAIGKALVRLRADGKLYSGSGISTDIVGASIGAYINAINKIAYEENA